MAPEESRTEVYRQCEYRDNHHAHSYLSMSTLIVRQDVVVFGQPRHDSIPHGEISHEGVNKNNPRFLLPFGMLDNVGVEGYAIVNEDGPLCAIRRRVRSEHICVLSYICS